MVISRLSPLLGGMSVLLLVYSFYSLYGQRRGSHASKIITWLSAAFIAVFWTLRLVER